jgi:hypothetical protein
MLSMVAITPTAMLTSKATVSTVMGSLPKRNFDLFFEIRFVKGSKELSRRFVSLAT